MKGCCTRCAAAFLSCQLKEHRDVEVQKLLDLDGQEALVILTDDVNTAAAYRKQNICCIGVGIADRYFDGVEFVLESPDDADEELLKRAWCHFHHVPYTIFRSGDVICRESVGGDYKELEQMSLNCPFVHFPARDVYDSYIETGYRLYGYGLWTVLVNNKGCWERAGWCGITPPDEVSEEGTVRFITGENDMEESLPQLGFVIRPDLRGRGIAKKACRGVLAYARDQLGIEALEIRTGAGNEAAAALARSLGFHEPKPWQA